MNQDKWYGKKKIKSPEYPGANATREEGLTIQGAAEIINSKLDLGNMDWGYAEFWACVTQKKEH